MDYRKQIFEMLGVEPEEEFKIKNDDRHYKITSDLTLMIDGGNYWTISTHNILEIFYGQLNIVKLPKLTPEDKIVIEYFRLTGFNWIAKDMNQFTYAYILKPRKTTCGWEFSGRVVQVLAPTTFVDWTDEEPYYIGGENNE